MTGYINKFYEDKNGNKNKNKITMSLKAKDKQFFKNYNKIWKKKERLMSINLYKKNIQKQIKTYEDSITTNFDNEKGSEKIQEEKIPCKWLSVIMIDS